VFSWLLDDDPWFQKLLDPVLAAFAADVGELESAPRRVGIVQHAPLIVTWPARI
jgi:hypothetical protein